MLSNTSISKPFWDEALACAGHLVNRLPSFAIGGKTPLEIWSGKVAQDHDLLLVFGSLAYYHVKEDKLDLRTRKSLFIGFKKSKRVQNLGSERQKIYL